MNEWGEMRDRARRYGWVVGAMVGSLFTIWAGGAAAEENSSQWRVSLGTGVGSLASRDEMGSPFLYRGASHPIWGAVRRSGENWQWGTDWRVAATGWNAGWLEAAISDGSRHRAEVVSVEGSIYGQREVARHRGHQLYLGGEVHHWTFFRSYHYDENQIGAVEVWEAPVSLNARAALVRRLGEWDLSMSALVPLGGRILRPNYAIRGDERIDMVERRQRILSHGSWSSWNRFQMLRGRLALSWQRERLGLRAEASVGWLRYQGEWETRAGQTQGLFGAEFVF